MTAFFHQSPSLAAVAVPASILELAGTDCPAVAIAEAKIRPMMHFSMVLPIQFTTFITVSLTLVRRAAPEFAHSRLILFRLSRSILPRNLRPRILRVGVPHPAKIDAKHRLLSRTLHVDGHFRPRSVLFEEAVGRLQQCALPSAHHLGDLR